MTARRRVLRPTGSEIAQVADDIATMSHEAGRVLFRQYQAGEDIFDGRRAEVTTGGRIVIGPAGAGSAVVGPFGYLSLAWARKRYESMMEVSR
jgi:hypothetical protein